MQQHDAYGKAVLRSAAGDACRDRGPASYVDYNGSKAVIDGTVGADIAVEVESRTGKQVRGAVLDLILHPYPKKLLLLILMHIGPNAPEECRFILAKFVRPERFRVVLLSGTGDDPQVQHDAAVVRSALIELGCVLNSAADGASAEGSCGSQG